MPSEAVDHRLAAVLYADVVGYSRLMAENEADTVRALNACVEGIGRLITSHRGRLVDTAGDSVLAEFPTATGAVEAAIEIQGMAGEKNLGLAHERRMQFRIGIHLGEVRIENKRIYGDAVNIAARIEKLAATGGVCMSSAVYEQVRSKLPLGCRDLGAKEIKNIPYTVRVYGIAMPAAPTEPGGSGPSRSPGDPGRSWSRRASIAVLPFEIFTPAPDGIAYEDILATEVIRALSHPHGLRVASRLATAGYRSRSADPRTIGHELGVDYVLTGNLRHSSDQAKVMIEIHDARTDSQLWTRTWSVPVGDLLAMPEPMAEAIVAVFEGEFVRTEVKRAAELPEESLDARGLLHKARIWFLGRYSEERLLESLDLTRRTLALRPDYDAAHATLALVSIQLALNAWGGPPEEMERQAMAAADRALELGPDHPICLENYGLVRTHIGDFEGAVQALRRAVEIAPTDLVAWAHLGFTLGWGGAGNASAEESDAILARISATMSQHPLAGFWPLFHSSALLRLGRFGEAIDACRRGIEAQPGFVFTRLALANALALDGEPVRAREALAQVPESNPGMTAARYGELVTRQSRGLSEAQINLEGLRKLAVL